MTLPLPSERVRALLAPSPLLPVIEGVSLGEDLELPQTCPFCGLALHEGKVMLAFNNGTLIGFSQTKRIGGSFYTWVHRAEGCNVPSLARIAPAMSGIGENE